MCGRRTLTSPIQRVIDGFQVREFFEYGEIPRHAHPLYNIAPTDVSPVVRQRKGPDSRELTPMRWGLIPSWAKDEKIGARMFNARLDSVTDKPAFRAAFERRRCLVPADGFFEWKKLDDGTKQPYYIQDAGGELIGFAGLWEPWKNSADEWVLSCTILTTEPNAEMALLHDRMPVIIEPEHYGTWLNERSHTRDELAQALQPLADGRLSMFPVTTHVNNSRHKDNRCIEPLN